MRVRGGAWSSAQHSLERASSRCSSGSYTANMHIAMSLHETKSDNVTAQEFARG